jgi:DNA-binding SARP family transcriptional activator
VLEARLLGRFEVSADGATVQIPSRPAQSLFAYLLLNAGVAHRRERLAGLLWPDSDEENARSNLRHALWRIRRSLEAAGAAAVLNADDLSVTVADGSQLWVDAAVLRGSDMTAPATDSLRERASAYGGELLPGFYDEWVILERERLKGIFERTMQQLLERLVDEQRWADVSEWGEHWISVAQSPEPAFRSLMVAAAARGDVSGVVTAYRRCVSALKSDLGVDPSEQTRTLYERLSRGQAPVLVSTRPAAPNAIETRVRDEAPAPGEPPYKGLEYFDLIDAPRFFGRDELVGRLAARVRERNFLAVIGASGSGKSSLVRAGLVPALVAWKGPTGEYRVIVITPTARPLESLAVALTPAGGTPGDVASLIDSLAEDPRTLRLAIRTSVDQGGSLLVVDQFEELFTECDDERERGAFIENLVDAAEKNGGASVVFTLRADFYGQCARYAALRDGLAANQEYIGPMTAPELRRAIEEPARRAGWEFEPGLVDLLLRDVGDEPGALPLLSHALLETWKRRRGRTMTLESYAESGGVHGAIARTAESVYNQRLTATERDVAKGIFLRLAAFGNEAQTTRRRVAIRDLAPSERQRPVVDQVLGILAEARLVTIGAGTVEVAHEALIREWPTLRQWLNDDREGLRIHRHLSLASQEWDATGRAIGELYRGARLGQALEWNATAAAQPNALEREFLDASSGEVNREIADRDARQRKELADQRRFAAQLRRRAYMLGGAFVIALLLAVAAIFFGEQARASAAAAEFEQQRAFLESARSAAASVESRLRQLRDAMNASANAQFMYLVETSDPSLPSVLFFMRTSGGDVVMFFVTETQTSEIVAPAFDRALRTRAERARDAAAGSAPQAQEACRELQQLSSEERTRAAAEGRFPLIYMSPPYAPAPGDTPSVAIAKYLQAGPSSFAYQQCFPYALTAEVSLRRADEWIVGALAPDDDAYLVDRAGRLLARARSSETEYLRDLSRSDFVAAGLASSTAFLRKAADPLDGAPRLAAAAPVGETGWRVIVVRLPSSVQRQVEPTPDQLRLFGALLAVLLVAVLAVSLVSRRGRLAAKARLTIPAAGANPLSHR